MAIFLAIANAVSCSFEHSSIHDVANEDMPDKPPEKYGLASE